MRALFRNPVFVGLGGLIAFSVVSLGLLFIFRPLISQGALTTPQKYILVANLLSWPVFVLVAGFIFWNLRDVARNSSEKTIRIQTKAPKDIVSFLNLAVWCFGLATLFSIFDLSISAMVKWVSGGCVLFLASILAARIASFRKYGPVYLTEEFPGIGVAGFSMAIMATVAFHAAMSWVGLVILQDGLYSGTLKDFAMTFVAYPLMFFSIVVACQILRAHVKKEKMNSRPNSSSGS